MAASQQISAFDLPFRSLPLTTLIDEERAARLRRRESYWRGTQHEHKPYDFDGYLVRWGDFGFDVPVSDYVPFKRRRPNAHVGLARVIVGRHTAMVFGHDKFPMIKVEGDPEAEDYARELARVSGLRAKMIEARNLGGACGSVAISWGFSKGRPLVEVHSPSQVEVLVWEDFEQRIPKVVMKCYPFRRRVPNENRKARFFYVRVWSSDLDLTWPEVPEELARTSQWIRTEARVIRHDLGICPVVWVQNKANSSDVDGDGDFGDDQLGDFDEMDVLLSATGAGTKANVDPTLVIKEDPNNNPGVVRKGSQTAIWSKGGAEYLELTGQSVKTALELLDRLRQYNLDKSDVVLLDPEKLAGAVSASSLEIRFSSQLSADDLFRDQYGEAIKRILGGMLTAARRLLSVRADKSGEQFWSRVDLEPRFELRAVPGPDGEKVEVQVAIDRRPGTSTRISLQWPPYFPTTWEDRKGAVETVKSATGGQQVLTVRSAVEALAGLFGIEAPDLELAGLLEEEARRDERARGLLDASGPVPMLHGDEELDGDEE